MNYEISIENMKIEHIQKMSLEDLRTFALVLDQELNSRTERYLEIIKALRKDKDELQEAYQSIEAHYGFIHAHMELNTHKILTFLNRIKSTLNPKLIAKEVILNIPEIYEMAIMFIEEIETETRR